MLTAESIKQKCIELGADICGIGDIALFEGADPQRDPRMILPKGKCVYEEGSDYEVDTHAVLHGYISITPLTIERTDLLTFETLKELNS